MPTIGYGNNGQFYAPSGLITWDSASPPEERSAGDDVWTLWALGETWVPSVAPADDEANSFLYPGGA